MIIISLHTQPSCGESLCILFHVIYAQLFQTPQKPARPFELFWAPQKPAKKLFWTPQKPSRPFKLFWAPQKPVQKTLLDSTETCEAFQALLDSTETFQAFQILLGSTETSTKNSSRLHKNLPDLNSSGLHRNLHTQKNLWTPQKPAKPVEHLTPQKPARPFKFFCAPQKHAQKTLLPIMGTTETCQACQTLLDSIETCQDI